MKPKTQPPLETIVGSRRSDKVASQAVLTLTSGDQTGRVVSVGTSTVTLGRSDECTVAFADRSLSRVHAKVVPMAGDYMLHDLGSKNGSFVNEVPVDFATQLESGDRIRLGDETTLRFFLVDEEEERVMRESFAASRRDALLTRFNALSERDDTMHDELVAAAEFQRRALAKPPALPGMLVDVLYRPLDLVGGDLYHVSQLPDGGVRVFLADATGHGLRASLSMMLMLSEYESAREAAEPALILRELNERFSTTHAHLGVRFTALCADLYVGRGQVRFASAANPAPWIARGAERIELDSGGPFVGLMAGLDFPEATVELRAGDTFVAFTDGIPDAFDVQGRPFGEARALDAVLRAEEGAFAASVEHAIDAFRGARPLDDDATLLAIQLAKR